MVLAVVHHMVVNTFMGTINLKPPSWAVAEIETPASLKG
jgi:hypothetical protein